MSDPDDFASFMAQGGAARVARLAEGQQVTGTVTQVGNDSVFVDLGSRSEGRIPRVQVELRDGSVPLAVGDSVQATVVDPSAPDGPLLTVKLSRDQRIDLGALRMAFDGGTPVEGTVQRAVKGGLELSLGGVRAFCPASQIERSYVSDLTPFVGQTVSVLITELNEADRNVVVSRRKALEQEQRQRAMTASARLAAGQDLLGSVTRLESYGAFVDLGGVEGLVHISELSTGRVERVEDVLSPGEEVNVRVLSIEQTDKGPRIRLSLKALLQTDAPQAPADRSRVLTAKVVRLLPHGMLVATEAGEGLLPKRELTLAPGADHRRAFAVGQELEVVLLDRAGDRMRFSMTRVEDVRAGQDYQAYREREAGAPAGAGMGSMAALLSGIDRAGLPKGTAAPPPVAKPAPVASEPPPPGPSSAAPTHGAPPAEPLGAPRPVKDGTAPGSGPASASDEPAGPGAPAAGPTAGEDSVKPRRRRIVTSGRKRR